MQIDTTRALKTAALGLLAGPAAWAQAPAPQAATPLPAPPAPAPYVYEPPAAPATAPGAGSAPAIASPKPAPPPLPTRAPVPVPAQAPLFPPHRSGGCDENMGPFKDACSFTVSPEEWFLTETESIPPNKTQVTMTVQRQDTGATRASCLFVLEADQELASAACPMQDGSEFYYAGLEFLDGH